MHQIHAIAAIVWIIVFFGHVYIGTIGTEGALEGMTTGRVSVEWAKQHHDLWYDEVKDQAGHAPEAGDAVAANAETSTT
jgi:formate dehydrogenase subunit gamma